jgi:hypothetical protein
MDKAKAAANIAKAKAEAALKKPPRQWETGICGCFEDFGGGTGQALRAPTPSHGDQLTPLCWRSLRWPVVPVLRLLPNRP